MKTVFLHIRVLCVGLVALLSLTSPAQDDLGTQLDRLAARQTELKDELKSLGNRRVEVEMAMRLARNPGVDVQLLTDRWQGLHDEGLAVLKLEIRDLKQKTELLRSRLKEIVGEDALAEEGENEADDAKALRTQITELERRRKDRQSRLLALGKTFPRQVAERTGGDKATLDRWRRLCREEEDRLRRESQRVAGLVEQLRTVQREFLQAAKSTSGKDGKGVQEEKRVRSSVVTELAERAADEAVKATDAMVSDWRGICTKESVRLRREIADAEKAIRALEKQSGDLADAEEATEMALEAPEMELYPKHAAKLRAVSAGLGDLSDPRFVTELKRCLDEIGRIRNGVKKLTVALAKDEKVRAEATEHLGTQEPARFPVIAPRLREQVEQLSAASYELNDRAKDTFQAIDSELGEQRGVLEHRLDDAEGRMEEIRQERGRIAEALKELRRVKEGNAAERMDVLIPAQIRRLRILGDARDITVEKLLKKHDTTADQLATRKRKLNQDLIQIEKLLKKQTDLIRKAEKSADTAQAGKAEKEIAKLTKTKKGLLGTRDDLNQDVADNAEAWEKACEKESRRLQRTDNGLREEFDEVRKAVAGAKSGVKDTKMARGVQKATAGTLEYASAFNRQDGLDLVSQFERNEVKWQTACRNELKRLAAAKKQVEEGRKRLEEDVRDLKEAMSIVKRGIAADTARKTTAVADDVVRIYGELGSSRSDAAFVKCAKEIVFALPREERVAKQLQDAIGDARQGAEGAPKSAGGDRVPVVKDGGCEKMQTEAGKLGKVIEALSKEADRWAQKSRDFELIIAPNRTDHYIETTFAGMRREEKLQPTYDGETVGDRVRGTLGGGEALKAADRVLSARRPENEDFREPVKVLWQLWEEAQGTAVSTAHFDALGKRLLQEIRSSEKGAEQELARVEDELEKYRGKKVNRESRE